MIYQLLFPKIHAFVDGGNKCHVIVVSALKPVTEEQVLELNGLGILAAVIGESGKTDDKILEAKES